MSDTAVSTSRAADGRGERRRWRDAVTPVDRASRRRWVCFYALLLVTGGALVTLGDTTDGTTFVVVAMAVVFGMLRRSTRRLTAFDHPDLDERDSAARDKAFRIAYALLLVVLLASALALILLLPDLRRTISVAGLPEKQGGWFLAPDALAALGAWGFLWAVYLPTGVLAWREPDALEPVDGAWQGGAALARDLGLAAALAASIVVALLGLGFWTAVFVLIAALSVLGALSRRSARQAPVAGSTLGAVGLLLVLGTAATVYLDLRDQGMDLGNWVLAAAVAITGSVLVWLGIREP